MDKENNNGKGKWIALFTSVLSFFAAVVFGAYVLGQRTGKVGELVIWKNETAPRIERMDAKGTLSFELFHEEYLRTQERQEKRLDKLEEHGSQAKVRMGCCIPPDSIRHGALQNSTLVQSERYASELWIVLGRLEPCV